MSHEHPGDDVRCDHCNRTGEPYTYQGKEFSGLHPNRGEQLCSDCLWAAVQADQDRPVGPMLVPARDYVTPIWQGSRKAAGWSRPSRPRGGRS